MRLQNTRYSLPAPSEIHPRFHFPHRFLNSGKERTAHDAVPDVEFMQMRQRTNLGDIHVIDTMTGINDQAELMGLHRSKSQSLKFLESL